MQQQGNQQTTPQSTIRQKIKIVPKVNVESTAANQHNSHLNVADADRLKEMMNQGSDKTITEGIIEWYFRTIADEIYKLSFIDEKRFNRIRMFWPSQYLEFFNQNIELVRKSDIQYYLNQFKGFDVEDYLDVLVFPQVVQSSNGITITFKLACNSFTMKATHDKVPIGIDGLGYFYQSEGVVYDGPPVLNALTTITNSIIQAICFRNSAAEQVIRYSDQQIIERIKNLLDEKTRLVLFELYDV